MKFDIFVKVVRYLLVIFFIVWGVSWLSIRGIKKDEGNRNLLEKSLVLMHDTPDLIKDWMRISEHQMKIIEQDDSTKMIGKLSKFDEVEKSLYLLYYNYMGDTNGKIFFQNIKSGEILFSWNIPLDKIMNDLTKIDTRLNELYNTVKMPLRLTDRVSKNIPAIQISAPVMLQDSSLVFHCGILGHLYKIDKNSNILWKSKSLTHHSIEIADDGTIWTCSINLENEYANKMQFRDDVILGLDQNGKEIHVISLTEIFMDNDLFETQFAALPTMHNTYGFDPYHLNDILPIGKEGAFWEKGDLFFSLRHQSMLALYRPSTGEIVWHQKGPWFAQHDINIVNDSVISVFNNNTLFTISNKIEDRWSDIAFYNFSSGKIEFHYGGVFASGTQGRQSLTSTGDLIVEETNKGKYIIFDKDKNVEAKFYIPFFSDSTNGMNPTWGRVYMQTENGFTHF